MTIEQYLGRLVTHPDNLANIVGERDLLNGDGRHVEWPSGAPLKDQEEDSKVLPPANGRRRTEVVKNVDGTYPCFQ
jgi:hypothetical protein